MTSRRQLVHLTTTDVSLDWLLGPQLEAFRDEGFDVTAVSAPGDHLESIAARGIRHVALESMTRRMDPLADVRAARELARVLTQLRPHVLHTHNPKPGVLGRLLGHRRGVPVVVNTVHGLYAQPEDRLRRRFGVYASEALAMRFSDMELVQNIEDMATLRRLGGSAGKLVHLGNGIDLGRFRVSTTTRARGLRLRRTLGIRPDALVVGMVGRLVREKGYEELLGAVHDLRLAGYEDVEFIVAGPFERGVSGAVAPKVVSALEQYGVHLLGRRDDIENVYAAMDMLVLPSHREGVPRAAMEASAMGLPVVATDIRGCRQVVADGMTGVLIARHDRRALARAVARLVDAPVTRRAMGGAGRRRAERLFDQDRVIELTMAVYRSQLLAAGLGPERSPSAINLRYSDSISLVDDEASKTDDAFLAA